MRWVALCAACVFLGSATARAAVLDALVARVDGRVITWSQVLQEAAVRKPTGDAEPQLEPRVVRESLVKRRLLVTEAEKLRLGVEDTEVQAALDETAEGAGEERFWDRVGRVGLRRSDLSARTRDLLLVRRYLDLRKEMTFVPESEIRTFYTRESEVLGERSLAEVRDEVRAYLAQKKYQRELAQWMDRQESEGRVELLSLPDAE